MKSLRLSGTLIVLLILAACSKDGINPVNSSLKPNGGNALPSGNYCGTVINVAAPDGIDDDQKLLDAFTAAKLAGPGSVVQLAEGTYRVGFIEIRDFFGSFVGAGKGKSIITFKTGLDCTQFLPNDVANWNVFIKFVGGDIYMADMTLKTPAERICMEGTGPWYGDCAMGQIIFSSRTGSWDSEELYIKAWINNVNFLGKRCEWGWGYNLVGGLMVMQCGQTPVKVERSQEDIKITNCTFDTFYEGVNIGWLWKSTLTVGEKNNGNIFKNCLIGLDFQDNINLDIRVTGNKFYSEGQFGLRFRNGHQGWTTDDPQTRRTTIDIEQNEFYLSKIVVNGTYTNGIIIHDPRRSKGENLPVAVLIKNNLFKFSEEGYRGILLGSTMDAVIRNNKFTGNGYEGILGSYWIIKNVVYKNGNTLVLGNNFSTSKFTNASIVLYPPTYDWSIVGGGSSNETILNYGTNNLITGVNIKDSEVPLGETIKDNMDMINDMFRDIKNRNTPF